jgi:hypothetical protein
MHRHPGLAWATVQARLEANPGSVRTLKEMEQTGGEPDVIASEGKAGAIVFCDCVTESPRGRRSLCYDRAGEQKRIKGGLRPGGNMIDMAAAMGVVPLTEEQYRDLQKLGEFDIKTQSWLMTPPEIVALGGAIFADRRFGRVFVYHNTTPCFFSSRGFRATLRV